MGRVRNAIRARVGSSLSILFHHCTRSKGPSGTSSPSQYRSHSPLASSSATVCVNTRWCRTPFLSVVVMYKFRSFCKFGRCLGSKIRADLGAGVGARVGAYTQQTQKKVADGHTDAHRRTHARAHTQQTQKKVADGHTDAHRRTQTHTCARAHTQQGQG